MSDKIIDLEERRKARDTVCCPICRSGDVARIVYGYPSDELLHSKDDDIQLGGCVVFEGSPEFQCKHCGWNF